MVETLGVIMDNFSSLIYVLFLFSDQEWRKLEKFINVIFMGFLIHKRTFLK